MTSERLVFGAGTEGIVVEPLDGCPPMLLEVFGNDAAKRAGAALPWWTRRSVDHSGAALTGPRWITLARLGSPT